MNKGATVLLSSVRPCSSNPVPNHKDTALSKTPKPWHPEFRPLFQVFISSLRYLCVLLFKKSYLPSFALISIPHRFRVKSSPEFARLRPFAVIHRLLLNFPSHKSSREFTRVRASSTDFDIVHSSDFIRSPSKTSKRKLAKLVKFLFYRHFVRFEVGQVDQLHPF